MARPATTVAVVALLALAGCTSLGGTPSSDPQSDPVYETPLDANAVTDRHVDALRDAGTFTLDSNTSFGTADETRGHHTEVIRADLDSGRLFVVSRQTSGAFQVYRFGNGTAYERRVSGGESAYVNASGSVHEPSAWLGRGVTTAIRLYSFEYAGTDDVDDERVHVYEAEGPSSLDTPADLFGDATDPTVESARATLLVRDDGLVTRVDYEYVVTAEEWTQVSSVTRTYDDVGSTDLSPPVWIPVARNATG